MTLTDLIARLESAEGPDTRLDNDICEALLGWPEREWRSIDYMKSFGLAVTSSVDAAIALAERPLPGCDICTQDIHADFRQEGEPRHIAEVMADLRWVTYDGHPEPNYEVSGAGQSNSRAIALCIAVLKTLRALQAKTGDRT